MCPNNFPRSCQFWKIGIRNRLSQKREQTVMSHIFIELSMIMIRKKKKGRKIVVNLSSVVKTAQQLRASFQEIYSTAPKQHISYIYINTIFWDDMLYQSKRSKLLGHMNLLYWWKWQQFFIIFPFKKSWFLTNQDFLNYAIYFMRFKCDTHALP